MNYELLNFIKCPLSKTDLKFKLISEYNKKYSDGEVVEIYEGLLFSETGFVFPIIKGMPRMIVEAIYDYADFLTEHLDNFDETKEKLEQNFPGLINYCSQKNKRTKKSFELEWSFLNVEKKDQIWQDEQSSLTSGFLNEVGESSSYFKDKIIIDIGSGHGLMTSRIADISQISIGVELSRAVENAYLNNKNKKAWFIQGDLQFLPFNDHSFDVLYASGVIHHTNNTELSLSIIESVIKPEGKICLWLYHPRQSLGHKLTLFLRRILSRIPLNVAFGILAVFVFPFTFLIKKLKNKNSPNYREEMIYLLDGMTPEFRFEIPHDLAIIWLQKRNYKAVQITTSNQFGYSISGEKGAGDAEVNKIPITALPNHEYMGKNMEN